MNIEQERELFEEWFGINEGVFYSTDYGEYVTSPEYMRNREASDTQYAWEGWQARAELQTPMNGE